MSEPDRLRRPMSRPNAEAARVVLLAGGRGEDHDVRAERMGKLHAHVPQTAETHHANLLSLRDAPAAYAFVLYMALCSYRFPFGPGIRLGIVRR